MVDKSIGVTREPGRPRGSSRSALATMPVHAEARKSMREILRGPTLPIQAKLRVGAPDDPHEREADRVAEQIMRMPDSPVRTEGSRPTPLLPTLQRKCAACEEQDAGDGLVQREGEGDATASAGVAAKIESLRSSGGQTLPGDVREFFEPRFGADFSGVRVHANSVAERAARDLQARAFTIGSDIAFGAGEYQPHTHTVRRLLAHELTHVVQQDRAGSTAAKNGIQRDGDPDIVRRNVLDDLRQDAEQILKNRLINLGNTPGGAAATFTHPGCPTTFCQPFPSRTSAMADLAWAAPLLLAGIAVKVNSRVVPLWARYLTGGTSPQTLTSTFGADFTASPTTATTTTFLVGELRRYVETNRSAILGGSTPATYDFTPRLSTALAAIDDPLNVHCMDFNVVADIAGNIAGGVGKDQTSHRLGARPSPFNDSREARVLATVTHDAAGNITVRPQIRFTVKDTIDLCPGNCGTTDEQVATIAMSRFEATGLAGDVPMIIEFNAPARETAAFVVPAPPAPAPAPVVLPGKVLFAFGSHAITPAGAAEITRVLPQIRAAVRTDIIGHTDSIGSQANNQALSMRRARAVMLEILRQDPTLAPRLTDLGRGEDEPIASNDTEAGRAQNRRVELVFH